MNQTFPEAGRPARARVAVENLGCKVNRYEADAIAQRFRQAGYSLEIGRAHV